MHQKTIEKLGLQLFAARQCVKRFEATAGQISAELKPLLEPGKPVVFGSFAVELVPVAAHTVPSYDVAASERIAVNERAPSAVAARGR